LFSICCDGAEYSTQFITVVLRKSEEGFGMTMSGFNPVFIQLLQEGNLINLHVCQVFVLYSSPELCKCEVS